MKVFVAVSTGIGLLVGVYLLVLFVVSLPPDADEPIDSDARDAAVRAQIPQEELIRYELWAQYPPDSRLLDESNVDLIDPYSAGSAPQMVSEQALGACEQTEDRRVINCQESPTDSGMYCILVPERTISTGLGEMHVFLRCYRQSRFLEPANLPLSSIEPRVYWRRPGNREQIYPLITHNDEGSDGDAEAGDYLYTFEVGHARQHWGWIDLEVSFEIEGLQHSQACSWFSTPHAVAAFQTNIADSIDDGHLIVSVPLVVNKPGYFEFDSNLQEQGGRYVASAAWKGDLAEGLQTIKFRFWGKTIRNSGADGPYLVREIRGRRRNTGITPSIMERVVRYQPEQVLELIRRETSAFGEQTEPLVEYLEPAAHAHITAAYAADEFSDEVWDSPAKQRRVRFLQSLIEQGEFETTSASHSSGEIE